MYFGLMASTLARATFCFSPPDSWGMKRSRNVVRPKYSAYSPMRLPISSRGSARFSRPKAISFSTLVMTSWFSGSWNTIPTTPASLAGGVLRVSSPSTVTRPLTSPP